MSIITSEAHEVGGAVAGQTVLGGVSWRGHRLRKRKDNQYSRVSQFVESRM